MEDKILFSLHFYRKFKIRRGIFENGRQVEREWTNKLNQFTYETVVFGGRVANFSNFIGHVVTDFWIFADELKSTCVDDVLVCSIVIVFHWNWFHRVQWIKEFGERYYDRFRICSLLWWQISARRVVGDQLPKLRPALVKIHTRGTCHFTRQPWFWVLKWKEKKNK